MSYDGYDDDDDFDSEASNPLRTLRKENRAKDKQIKELQEQLTALSKAQRERSVSEVLTSRGFNKKIAAFIPETITSEEEVASWLEEFGDVFGATPAEPEVQGESPDPRLEALQKIAEVQNTGQAPTGDSSQIAALIASARTPEELNKVLFGNEYGPAAT